VFSQLVHNQILVIALCTWAITQTAKVLIILIQEKRLAWNFFISSGGMPSAHSATVCSLATSIAMTLGVSSTYFSIAVVLAVIVIYDATGVRQSVGQHSVVLNRLVKEFSFRKPKPDLEKDLKEFIGHTPIQVLVGAGLGIFITWLWVAVSRG
jgi:acid phosphatase family membrane protein YuiD